MILDKFLDIMKLNDDYDDDDYLGDDDYDDDYDDKKRSSKSGFFNKKNKYDDDDDYEDEIPAAKSTRNRSGSSNNKVTPIRQTSTSSRHASSGGGVCLIKPTSIDDGREICETLLDNRTVILNLEGLDLDIAQRIIDFTSGSTYAIKGNLQKVSNFIFLVTPENVDISGDMHDLLSNSYDVSSVRTRF